MGLLFARALVEDTPLHRAYAVLLCGGRHGKLVALSTALAEVGWMGSTVPGSMLCRLLNTVFTHPDQLARRLRGYKLRVDGAELYLFLRQLEATGLGRATPVPAELEPERYHKVMDDTFQQVDGIWWKKKGDPEDRAEA